MKKVMLFLLIFSLSIVANAQFYLGADAGFGMFKPKVDKFLNFSSFYMYSGVNFGYQINDFWALRAGFGSSALSNVDQTIRANLMDLDVSVVFGDLSSFYLDLGYMLRLPTRREGITNNFVIHSSKLDAGILFPLGKDLYGGLELTFYKDLGGSIDSQLLSMGENFKLIIRWKF